MPGSASLARFQVKWPIAIASLILIGMACNFSSAITSSTSTPKPTPTTEASATPAPSATPVPDIVGTYHCSGHEGGTLASAAVLTLYSDGTYLDGPPPVLSRQERRGEWRLREAEGILEFPGDPLFAQGEYDAERQHLFIRLQEGMNMVHAEEGTLSCDPSPSLAPDD